MKKLVVLLAVLFAVPSFGFAQSLQEENERLRKENRKLRQYLPLKRPWVIDSYKRALPYPITIGLFGFGSFDYLSNYNNGLTGIKRNRLDSGGLGFRTKVNINRWFGVSVDLLGDVGVFNAMGYGSFEFRPMVVFQRETLRSQKGFVPYGGVGATIGNFYGVVANIGLRYNTTQNMFVGTEVSLTFGPRVSNGISHASFATKVGVEVGYRF